MKENVYFAIVVTFIVLSFTFLFLKFKKDKKVNDRSLHSSSPCVKNKVYVKKGATIYDQGLYGETEVTDKEMLIGTKGVDVDYVGIGGVKYYLFYVGPNKTKKLVLASQTILRC